MVPNWRSILLRGGRGRGGKGREGKEKGRGGEERGGLPTPNWGVWIRQYGDLRFVGFSPVKNQRGGLLSAWTFVGGGIFCGLSSVTDRVKYSLKQVNE